MKLLDMRLRNFMRFRKAHMKLDAVGMVLIEGVNHDDASATSNGSGKSTLVDALVWCLYGVTTHEPSAQGDDVVNEKRLKNCEVSVRFELAEQLYTVTRRRAWKKGGKSVQLTLTRAGKALTKGTVKDTQAELEKLVGMGVATFRHACVFGQGRAYRFSRLTDGEKKAVLDEMLGSEIYARAGQTAAERLVLGERELGNAETALETALESLQDARKRLSKLQTRAEDAAHQAQTKRSELKHRLHEARSELGAIEVPAARETALVIAETNEHEAKTVWRRTVANADASAVLLRQLETKRTKISAAKNTECVTCGQAIDEAFTDRQLEAIDEQIEMQNANDHLVHEAALDAKRKHDERKEHTKKLRADCDKVREQKHVQRRLKDKVSELKLRLSELRDTSYDELVSEERARVKKLKQKTRKLQAFVKLRTNSVAQLQFWQQGFSAKGLRSLMLDSSLPYLNAKLDQYTNALTAGNIEVEFRTQRELKGGGVREDFHVYVRNKHGSAKYSMNSVGERAKIDIIVGLALQDMAASRSKVPINVAFFDEIFDGLDPQGVDRAVQVLSQLKRESAFVISHNSELKTFFSKRLVVIKEHGESRLEQS